MLRKLLHILVLLCVFLHVESRRHVLKLKNDLRGAVLCSKFGFQKGGYFSVSIEQLKGELEDITFTFDRSESFGVASYLETKTGNCFRGDPQKFLYLSFDKPKQQLVIHNQDMHLQGLVFEAVSENMEEETGQNTVVPATLQDAIRLVLESLNLPMDNSASVSAQLTELVKSVSKPSELPSYEQSSVYLLLRQLAQLKLSELSLTAESDLMRREVSNETMKDASRSSNLPETIETILKDIYNLVTPFGSLRAVPFKIKPDGLQVRFTVRFPNTTEEGLYNFYLHNCPPITEGPPKRHALNITLNMVEKNTDSYLSAGQRPLPLLYGVMCFVYLTASVAWFLYLRTCKHLKFRIHYLMLAVVVTKAVSLAFHGVNYYVIGKHGVHEEGWAVMYYITHIIRGALLFITILLIGAGWTFIKHMLTPRERNVFLIVIPLQILANVATVVIEESEAGSSRYTTWRDIFIFVDLACCGAILFPVVWSIRHLQMASQSDGKAAINLRNLRLFRHFYILVICYVYFTRVVAYLLNITVPFSYSWTVELFRESITFIFFLAVGYKFRPIDDNPYLLVPNEEEEEDTVMERIQLEDMWSQSGMTDGVTRLSRSSSHGKSRSSAKTNQGFVGQDGLTDEHEASQTSTGV